MIFARRRYYFWLIRAYIKRWRATIFTSAILGAIIFFGCIAFVTFYLRPFLERKIEKTGIVGVYTPETLPESLFNDVSYGLTTVDESGGVHPAGRFLENYQ